MSGNACCARSAGQAAVTAARRGFTASRHTCTLAGVLLQGRDKTHSRTRASFSQHKAEDAHCAKTLHILACAVPPVCVCDGNLYSGTAPRHAALSKLSHCLKTSVE